MDDATGPGLATMAAHRPGAHPLGEGRCRFVVWAPRRRSVEVRLLGPPERPVPLERAEDGFHSGVVDGVDPGTRYLFRLDGDTERPDPASRYQPEGVHGPSEVVDPSAFAWGDQRWRPPALEDFVTYEVHPGTFSPEGTFDGIAARLDHLVSLGVNALEVMPVAQFPGARNWGYDGVGLYAVQNTYGGPEGLRALVDACHRRGLAVVLDVVYNHLGPEGNYLDDFGPYFTDRYHTPWGRAVNYDGPWSDEVRAFFLDNARTWMMDYHVDALRLDAIHGIFDASAHPFLQELAERTSELEAEAGRPYPLIAESDLNDVRVIRPPECGGFGIDAQWSDDFHHSVHALLTGERDGYYVDFGTPGHLVRAITDGYVYGGQRSAYRKRRHGSSGGEVRPNQLVVAVQNHDQVGNRMKGDRLSTLVGFERLKIAAGLLLLSPSMPLLFMGEEYGETAPFLYFVSHSDRELSAMVRKGRAGEFRSFGWKGELPDPTAEATFRASMLDWSLASEGEHRALLDLYRELLRLRRELPLPAARTREEVQAWAEGDVVLVARSLPSHETLAVFNVGTVPFRRAVPAEGWQVLVDSSDSRWNGPGSGAPRPSPTDPGGPPLEVRPDSFVLVARPRPA